MKKNRITFIKQSTLLNVGHIYEHIIYSKFEYATFNKDIINGIDYNILEKSIRELHILTLNISTKK